MKINFSLYLILEKCHTCLVGGPWLASLFSSGSWGRGGLSGAFRIFFWPTAPCVLPLSSSNFTLCFLRGMELHLKSYYASSIFKKINILKRSTKFQTYQRSDLFCQVLLPLLLSTGLWEGTELHCCACCMTTWWVPDSAFPPILLSCCCKAWATKLVCSLLLVVVNSLYSFSWNSCKVWI